MKAMRLYLFLSFLVLSNSCVLEKAPFEIVEDDDDNGSDADTDTDTDTGTDTDTDSDADTDTIIDTDTTTNTDIFVDCHNLTSSPLAVYEMTGPSGYHDVAFDDSGNIVGAQQSGGFDMNLVKTTYTGTTTVFVPDIGHVQGMDFLASGDLIVASDSGLLRVNSSGQSSVIDNDNDVYGVTIGPDGNVYTANEEQIVRVNPDTSERDVLFDTNITGDDWMPRVVNFSPDLSTMYIATRTYSGSGGEVYSMALDANLDPTEQPQLFASNVGSSWQDALAIDECGNLYVPEYFSSGLYRISPEGVVETFHTWSSGKYGHGMEWGSGINGWNEKAIYMPQPYDGYTVVEVAIGLERANY